MWLIGIANQKSAFIVLVKCLQAELVTFSPFRHIDHSLIPISRDVTIFVWTRRTMTITMTELITLPLVHVCRVIYKTMYSHRESNLVHPSVTITTEYVILYIAMLTLMCIFIDHLRQE